MMKSPEDQQKLKELELRIKTTLPEEYHDSYEEVQPVSMGSASLKYGRDGKVAWNEIWGKFCDLAMAGGPPHKGILLEPGSRAEIDAQPERYREVVEEICRGVALTTGLPALPSPVAGWVRLECPNRGTAEWLARAIVMENISARFFGTALDLPAGPAYRVEKEIKNVITALSKTCHYWFDHMVEREQKIVEALFAQMEVESPLMQPAFSDSGVRTESQQLHCTQMSENIRQLTGLKASKHKYTGWLGVDCPDVRAAIWMMRAMVASNVLSRREGTVLFLPVNPVSDPAGEIVIRSFVTVHGFAVAQRILR